MVQITHFVISRNIASHSIAGPRTPASTRATSSVVPVHRQPRETAHFKSRKSLRVRAVDPQILEPAEYAREHDRKIGLCQIGAQAPVPAGAECHVSQPRSEEHTSELQSLMRISYAVFCL